MRSGEGCLWRREWDSNPGYGCPYTRFPSVRLQPLGHPSGETSNIATSPGRTTQAEPPPNHCESLQLARLIFRRAQPGGARLPAPIRVCYGRGRGAKHSDDGAESMIVRERADGSLILIGQT